MKVGDIIQFNEKHKWAGCLGIITDLIEFKDDVRFTVGVPYPVKGVAYIYVMESEMSIERIGEAKLVLKDGEEWRNA